MEVEGDIGVDVAETLVARVGEGAGEIGSQSDPVRRRAWARKTPMRNRVVKPASTSIGSVNWSKEWAREMKPEVQVTEVVV